MNFLLDLRTAASGCSSNVDYRQQLKDSADTLQLAIRTFALDITRENLGSLNGLWSRAERLLTNLPKEAPPNPLEGGMAEGALRQVAA